MVAIYSNGGNHWNILGFNFTKRDALSSCIRIVQYDREDYTRVSSDRAKIGHVTM
jgi:hypothetical protein